MFVVLNEERLVVGIEHVRQLLLQLLSGQDVFLQLSLLLHIVAAQLLLGGRLVLLDVIDVRKASKVFPATNGLQDSHVLVVGVVPGAEVVQYVAELLLALEMLLMLLLQGLQNLVVL